jgi:hypothetical protein
MRALFSTTVEALHELLYEFGYEVPIMALKIQRMDELAKAQAWAKAQSKGRAGIKPHWLKRWER